MQLHDYSLNPSFYIAASLNRDPGWGFEIAKGSEIISKRGYRLEILNPKTNNQHKYTFKIDHYKILGPRFISQLSHVMSLKIAAGSVCFRLSDNKYYEIKTVGQFIDFWNDLLNTTIFYPIPHQEHLSIKDALIVSHDEIGSRFVLQDINFFTRGDKDLADSDNLSLLSISNLKEELSNNRDSFSSKELGLFNIIPEKFNDFSHFLLFKTYDGQFSIAIPIKSNISNFTSYKRGLSPLYEFIKIDPTSIPNEVTRGYKHEIDWERTTREWKVGRFEDVFQELFKIIKNFRSLDINEVQFFIKNLSELDRKPLSFMGIYTSFEKLASISIFIIFLILLYFYECLKSTQSLALGSTTTKAVWIGLNNSFCSRFLLLLTCPVLIIVTIGSILKELVKSPSLNFTLIIIVGLIAFTSIWLSILIPFLSFKVHTQHNE